MGVRHTVLNSMGNKVMRVRGSWIKVRRTGGKLQMWAHSAETDSTEGLGPERENMGIRESKVQPKNQRLVLYFSAITIPYRTHGRRKLTF